MLRGVVEGVDIGWGVALPSHSHVQTHGHMVCFVTIAITIATHL